MNEHATKEDFAELVRLMERSITMEPSGKGNAIFFTAGQFNDGKCVGNVHVATGEGWCLCGEVREI